jgi:hypothetical protein
MRAERVAIIKMLTRSTRSVLVFFMHQIIATEGVIWVTVFCAFLLRGFISGVHEPWRESPLLHGIHWLLVDTPLFPVQISVGLWFGWKLFSRLSHHVMFWVWVLPGVLLAYAVIAIPTLSPWSASVFNESRGPLAHYFGWGCRVQDRCFDQLTFTLPFYTSLAYGVGAALAQRFAGHGMQSRNVRSPA